MTSVKIIQNFKEYTKNIYFTFVYKGVLMTDYNKNEDKMVESSEDIVTVRPDSEIISKQQLPYFVGISGDTAGSKGISLNLIVIPPGGSAEPHLHKGYESAIYILSGHVTTKYGIDLKKSTVNKQGDFIFIPPNVPHQPINMSDTEPVKVIVARNDPNEQEHVFLLSEKKS